MSAAGSRLSRSRALDGLRGLAVAAVLAYHLAPGSVHGGFFGVEVFFILSGYLLTTVLLGEHTRTGAVSWWNYGRRRVRRVIPAMVVFLAALIVLGTFAIRDDAHRIPGDVVSSLFGVTNWHLISDGTSYFASLGRPPMVRHLWSLAIEFQFYLLCPLVVACLLRMRYRLAVGVIAAGIVASSIAMSVLYDGADPSRAYFGTDARIAGLLSGMLVAFVVHRLHARDPEWHTPTSLQAAATISLVVLAVFVVAASERSAFLYPAGFTIVRVATAFVIVGALGRGRTRHALEAPWLHWLGVRSYSIYLWHWPFIVLLRPGLDVGWPAPVAKAVALAGGLLAGSISYQWIERPFLHGRREATPRVMRPAIAIAFAAIAILFVNLPTVDPLTASLEAGQAVLDAQGGVESTTTSSSTTTTAGKASTTHGHKSATSLASKPVAASHPTKLRPGPKPGTVHVSAIGDSVMLSAAGQLKARLGTKSFIDAAVGRQFRDGIGTARALRKAGRLGDVVVIHLGTNGPPRGDTMERLMAELKPTDHVLLVTVRMPRSWEAETNDALRAAAKRYHKVKLVNWHDYSGGHRDWFASDGVHLTRSGGEAYARLIGSAIPPPPKSTSTTTTTKPTTTTTKPTTTTTEPPTTTTTEPPTSTTKPTTTITVP